MAPVVLSVVEQRLDAVRAVLDGADVVEVATSIGVHRTTLHRWIARYLTEQLAGLADRSHRPHQSPRQVAEAVEVAGRGDAPGAPAVGIAADPAGAAPQARPVGE